MNSTIVTHGERVSGSAEYVRRLYERATVLIASGKSGDLVVAYRDGDYRVRRAFFVTPHSHISATLAFSPAIEMFDRFAVSGEDDP